MPSRRTVLAGLIVGVVALGAVATVASAPTRATNAESDYVATRLADAACLDDWGVNEGAASGSVAVTGLSPGGVRVSVTLPYAYRVETDEGPVFADTASEAVYVVSPFRTRRISGDEIAPC
ncbi:MAG: hypothetical protein ABEI96_09235 [Haloarculaceae archaeon]